MIPSKIRVGSTDRDVTSVGDSAFRDCNGLISVTVSNGITSIGDSAFRACSGLISFTINSESVSIGNNAFSGCFSLVEVCNNSSLQMEAGELGNQNGYIARYALNVYSDDSGESILSETEDGYIFMEFLGEHTLVKYRGYAVDITLPSSFDDGSPAGSEYSIYQYAFNKRADITSVTLGSGVVGSIGDRAFSQCTGLTSIDLGDRVDYIGDYAFYGCVGLTSMTMPASVTEIARYAFSGCYSLVEILDKGSLGLIAGSSNNGYIAYFAYNVYYDGEESILRETPDGYVFMKLLGEYHLVKYKGGTVNITLPSSFEDGPITVSVYGIFEYAFSAFTRLTSVTIPESVIYVGSFAFDGCTGLTSVTIPASVVSIDGSSFRGCTGMESILVNEDNGHYSSEDGVLYNKDKTELILCPATRTGQFEIPASVTVIEEYAFYGCTGLTSVVIPASVTVIEDHAFQGCTGLTSVTIPGNVTSIGDSAFRECTGLTSLTIPAGITSLEPYALYGCAGLISVTIPANIASVGSYAFSGCTGLVSVVFEGTPSSFGSSSFNLGNASVPVTCTVYSGISGNFLETYKGSYTTFDYEPYVLHRLTVDPNGGSYESVPDGWTEDGAEYYRDFAHGSLIIVPEGLRKTGHAFSAWDLTVPTLMPDEGITLTAQWTVNRYTVTFDDNGGTGTVSAIESDFDTELTVPGYGFVRTGYTQTGWNTAADGSGTAYSEGDEFPMPEDGLTLYAEWTILRFTVLFESGGEVFETGEFDYGTEIAVPAGTPTKSPVGPYTYEFTGWMGYIDGMTVSGDITFTALFSLHMDEAGIQSSVRDGTVEVDTGADGDEISGDTFERILDAISGDPSITGVSVSVPGGSVYFDRAAAESLRGTGSVSVTISEADADGLSEAVRSAVGDRPVFRVSVGGASSFGGGSLTVTLRYDLRTGEDPNGLSIWFVDDDGTVEEYACTYSDGYVTFVTNHLSYYSVMYSQTGGEGFPVTYIAVAAIAAAAVAGAVLFIRRRA